MIGFKFNRSIPTTLKLNGPTLGYLQQVTNAEQDVTGVVTFSGISTVTYPPATTGTVTPLIQVQHNGYPVRGYLYYPTSANVGDNLDVVVLYHGTITSPGVTPPDAASTFMQIALNQVNLRDKLIFSVAYPQDAIPDYVANPPLATQQFPGIDLSTLYIGDNIVYAEAALLWVKNELGTYLSNSNISKTVDKVYTFGHSQGAYLTHRLNILHTVDGVISNAPGPIDLLSRCSGDQNTGNFTCNKINTGFGSTITNPSAYDDRSLKNFLSGTLSPTLFTQALDDTTGDAFGSPQVANMQNIVQAGLNTCTDCASVTFNYYPTGGHDAFAVNKTLQSDIRTFVGSEGGNPPNQETPEGTLDFKWYLDDVELNTSMTSPSVSIVSVGNSSTLTLDNLPLSNDGSRVYLKTDYIPASGEANANNEPLQSDTGTIELIKNIQILTQPVTQNVASGDDVTYTVDAQLENGLKTGLQYQWYFDGSARADGTVAGFTYSGTNTPSVNVAVNENITTGGPAVCISVLGLTLENQTTINNDWTTFRSNYPQRPFYILQPQGMSDSLLKLPYSYTNGSDGLAYPVQSINVDGGDVNQTSDWFSMTGLDRAPSGTSVSLAIDDSFGTSVSVNDNRGSISLTEPFGSGVRYSVTRFLLPGSTGTEGNPVGHMGYFITFPDLGSTGDVEIEIVVDDFAQRASGLVAPNADISTSSGYPQRISANQFKVAFDMTGSSGLQSTYVRSWGFNFVSPIVYNTGGRTVNIMTRASFNQFAKKCRDNGMNLYLAQSSENPSSSMTGERWAFDHNRALPEVGANTVQNLYCQVSHPQSFNSPQNSNTVTMSVVPPRPLLLFEGYSFNNAFKRDYVDFDRTPDFTANQNLFGPEYSIIQFHAVEKNVPIIMNMFGAKGTDNGANVGGEGGVATIRFTAHKDVEYTLIGLSNNSAIFLYRGSNLIAVVGAGGDGGSTEPGGAGGGIDIAGQDAAGSRGGDGGSRDSLSLNGTFGSILAGSGLTLQSGDDIAGSREGGRTISCTKGSYWIDQAISACSNNSSDRIQFVNVDGTTITESSSLIRGFKPGYTITSTEGKGENDGGDGGAGATGGDGGVNGGGGGGGSGYTDGSVEVISTRLGGSTGLATIEMRTEASKFVHFFDNSVRPKRTTSLTRTGNIVSISAQSENGNGSPGDTSAKHYLVTMDDDYQGLSIDVTSDLTAAGGSTDPNMYAASIIKQNSTQWRVWFVRGGGSGNTFVREAEIIGNL